MGRIIVAVMTATAIFVIGMTIGWAAGNGLSDEERFSCPDGWTCKGTIVKDDDNGGQPGSRKSPGAGR